ncbi:hypothetical protein Verru16b_03064 [Lacunisphaera limnophila]|uniref:Uncharacterized protein n=1 Tax=Lacunisphaera limnophila TaxID=1838286 RepID=A0A1D8AYJ1_9BACT|nr:hypothetical protein [Lacunisphaera limnophila]AOS45973.1 hypothetical protein Verru16b_03064 [Lacunisphaera limnophila]
MKLRLPAGLALCLLLPFVPAQAQTPASPERAAAAQLLVFGRPAATATAADASATLADLVAGHRSSLQASAAARRDVLAIAARDTLGRPATEAELTAWAAGDAVTYAEGVKAITAWLAGQPEENRQVINRAYQLVIKREAYVEEYAYWQPRGTLPYVLLVGAIENWGERNQPGLMVTNGTPSLSVNSRFLRTLRLSPAVANEARTLLGLPVWSDVARLRNPGHHVVAVGAADLASVGGIHFMPTGGGPLAGE